MALQSPLTSAWRTSSYSDSARQCVEIAQAGVVCLVRDTKDRQARHISFSPAAWTAFTQALKGGLVRC